MKNRFLLVAFLFVFGSSFGQSSHPQLVAQVLPNYENYKEPLIKTRLFKHSDVVTLIQKHVNNGFLRNEIIAQSVQGRSIHHLTLGKGKIKVLLWSQMHGDEATATMALFDLFNFLAANDQFNSIRENLLANLELHIVPMLNPDGAEIWTRTNAMKIDLNRDAQNLATPEAIALMNLAKKIKPDFGFNLHDQSTYYAAGKNTNNPATISFLAPAYNVAKEMNPTRTKAVQLIVSIHNAIQTLIPNKVAKYNDTHDPRCFGDTFQGMGISTILIESGGYPNDPQKQEIRKVNFYGILAALNAIANQSYLQEDVNTYWNLPNNTNNLQDLIIRNIAIPLDSKVAITSLGIKRIQKISEDALSLNYAGTIVKMEKLDSAFAYQEIDGNGFDFQLGKTIEMTKEKWEILAPEKEFDLLKQGYLYIKWKDAIAPVGPIKNRWLNLINQPINGKPILDGPANFILAKNNKPVYAIVNGFLVDLSVKETPLLNTMSY